MMILQTVIRKNSIFLISIFVLLSGCSHTRYTEGSASGKEKAYLYFPDDVCRKRVEHLKKDLGSLDPNVDETEAANLATAAIYYSINLANQYRMVRIPIFHNILVNAGVKDRGLCVHWTEDLLRHLAGLELQTFQLHWGVANKERTFYIEHSSVVVTAAGQSFEEGLVLDPWRNSGELFWGRIKGDRYPWKKWIHFNAKKIHESYRHP